MMRLLLTVLLLLLPVPVVAQEKITLSVAETKPSNSEYRIEQFNSVNDDPATTPLDEGYLFIGLKGQNGESVGCTYNTLTTPTGTFLNTQLNKANMSTAYAGNATTGSLRQRIHHRLVVMGESTAVCGKTLTGTLTGAVP